MQAKRYPYVSYLFFVCCWLIIASLFLRNLRYNTANPLVSLSETWTGRTQTMLGVAHHGWGMLLGPFTQTFVVNVHYTFTDGTIRNWNVFPVRQGFEPRVWNETGEDLFIGVNRSTPF